MVAAAAVVTAPAAPGLATASAVAAGVSGLLWVESAALSYDAVDPPDPHFMSIAVPSPLRVPTIKPGPGLALAGASAINKLSANICYIVGLETALLEAMERAWGAADAHATIWVKKQSLAAASLSTSLAGSYRQLASMLPTTGRILRAEHFAAPVFSEKDLSAILQYLKIHGFPSTVMTQLRAFGLGNVAIASIRNSILQAKPQTSTTSFAAVLDNPLLEKSISIIGQTFSSYAAGVREKLATY